MCVCVCVFTKLSTLAGRDTRSIIKCSLIGVNSDFSFFYTGCQTYIQKPSRPYSLPDAGEKIIGFIPFLWELARF